MSPSWKLWLSLFAIGLALPMYLLLRPAPPASPPHRESKELVCLDPTCGFRAVFTEAEALKSVQENGHRLEAGIDYFHCPRCGELKLYRSVFSDQ